MRGGFIGCGDRLEGAGEVGAAGVPEALMPQVGGAAGEEAGGGGCRRDGVEIACRITSEEHLAGMSILNRKANIVKFNVYGIGASKHANG